MATPFFHGLMDALALKSELSSTFNYGTWQHQVCNTLEYLITLQHLLNVHNGKLDFIWLAKKDNLMPLDQQFKAFSINLNTQHVNGMTPFDLAVHMYGY